LLGRVGGGGGGVGEEEEAGQSGGERVEKEANGRTASLLLQDVFQRPVLKSPSEIFNIAPTYNFAVCTSWTYPEFVHVMNRKKKMSKMSFFGTFSAPIRKS
jgi:hypothetical protein